MKSTSSSSASTPSETSPEPLSYKNLLADKDRWGRLLLAYRGKVWEDLSRLMAIERSQHLEALLNTDDPTEALTHKAVARWIGDFMGLGEAVGIMEELREAEASEARAQQPLEDQSIMLRDSGDYDDQIENDLLELQ